MRYGFFIAGCSLSFALGCALRPIQSRETASPAAEKISDCAHDASTLRCVHYKRNYDGDTITFQIPGVHPIIGRDISVRVFGIDTPEMKGKAPCEVARAREAKDLVTRLLQSARNIELRNIQRDKYFRILAEVVADGISVSERLIDAKLAYPYDGGTKRRVNWCQLALRP